MRNFILLITLLMVPLFFVNNPFGETARLQQAVWNVGHLFFFALLTWLLITCTALRKQSNLKIFWASLIFSLLLGAAIEVAQSLIGRSMEWQDVLTDVLGGALGFLVVQYAAPKEQRFTSKIIISVLALGVCLVALYPIFQVIRDDFKISSSFPTIANFESAETLRRWDVENVRRFEIDSDLYTQGHASVLVEFEPARYSSISLFALSSDWSQYQFLNLSIHNDQNEDLEIELKVYDYQHRKNGSNYHDRFNREMRIQPGWNHINIKLLDILHAPKNRKMELDDIAGLSLFLSKTPVHKTIHLDNIYLSK